MADRRWVVTDRLNEPPGVVIVSPNGDFWTRCPSCVETGPLDHEVTFHTDGTVSVVPSIQCACGGHFLIERSVVRLV